MVDFAHVRNAPKIQANTEAGGSNSGIQRPFLHDVFWWLPVRQNLLGNETDRSPGFQIQISAPLRQAPLQSHQTVGGVGHVPEDDGYLLS